MKILSLPLNFPSYISPERLFEQFADLPWAIWLDSCDHEDSHYDILVWQPKVTLVTKDLNTDINQCSYNELFSAAKTEQTFTSQEDPLKLLEQQQRQCNKGIDTEHISFPFKTGAVGLFSYDLGRRFEKITTHAQHDITLADMAVGIYQQAIIYDNKNQQFYLLAADDKIHQLQEQLLALEFTANKSSHFELTSTWQANMDKALYDEKFSRVQHALLEGDCYQVNLAQRFSASYQGNEFQAYKKLRQKNKAPFSAFMRLEDHAILSLSPERFIQLDNGRIESKPIKGTLPRSEDKKQDQLNAERLKNSNKDRAENLMIVDLLRNDISKVSKPGSVKVPKLFAIESYPAVHHLVSTVEGELEDKFSATDLLRGAFPGGSITGAPKISAMHVIEALEPHRRSLYCGSMGYISACGNMDTSITIRTLICEQSSTSQLDNSSESTPTNKLYCWAGGGIVADSNVDAEYQETFDKVNKILPILDQA